MFKPELIAIFPSRNCNFNCKFCVNRSNNSKTELPLSKIEEIMRAGADIGATFFGISGGEPFLRKDVFDILDLATKYSYGTSIGSNGSTLTPSVCKKLSRYDVSLQLSIDSYNRRTNADLRDPLSLYSSLEAINSLRKNGWNNIKLSTLVTQVNYPELNSFVESTFEELEIPLLHVMRPAPGSPDKVSEFKDYSLDQQHIKMYGDLLEALKSFYQDTKNYHLTCKSVSYPVDSCPWNNTICINWDGKVNPCCQILHLEEASIGNIFDEPLDEILRRVPEWQKKHFKTCFSGSKEFITSQGYFGCYECVNNYFSSLNALKN